MTKGMNVECGKCRTHYNIYQDIQTRGVGICPICNNVEGFKFEHPFTFEYNNGDVNPHLEGEDNYDWDWLMVENGSKINLGNGSSQKAQLDPVE